MCYCLLASRKRNPSHLCILMNQLAWPKIHEIKYRPFQIQDACQRLCAKFLWLQRTSAVSGTWYTLSIAREYSFMFRETDGFDHRIVDQCALEALPRDSHSAWAIFRCTAAHRHDVEKYARLLDQRVEINSFTTCVGVASHRTRRMVGLRSWVVNRNVCGRGVYGLRRI